MNDLVAIIPARSGSQRIPRKNLIDFEGRPLIAWTIDAARECGCFDRIIVSTDDRETAELSKQMGAEVPSIRTRYADDHSPVSLATVDAVERIRTDGKIPPSVVQLFAVCPLRTGHDIREAVAAFYARQPPFQISCYRWRGGHPYWSFTLDAGGDAQHLFPEQRFARSQDLPSVFVPSGATWIARTASLLEYRTFYGPGHVYREMPWQRAIDIDTIEDLELARLLHRAGLAKS